MKLGTDLVPHRQACGTGHPDPGQQNATPRAKKRNPDKKFMEGTRSIVRGRGSELFSGLRFFAWVNFVCDFTIQILYAGFSYKFLLSQLILHWNVPLSTVHYIYIQFKARDSSSTPVGRSVSTRMSVHACARGFEPPMSHALAPRAARAPDPRGTPMAQRRCPSAALILSHAVDF